MIGDNDAKGKGVGTAALKSVIKWALQDKQAEASKFNFSKLETRCKTNNQPAIHINEKLGFKPIGNSYKEDGFEWQNYKIERGELNV